MKSIIYFFFILCLSFNSCAQKSLIQSGPMLGYNEMKEVMLWVQTKESASVKIAYWEDATPEKKYFTNEKLTKESDGFTAKLIANKVSPGTQYSYQVYVNNQVADFPYPTSFKTQTDWAYKMDPPNFKVALGSCTYINNPPDDRPGKPYGGGYEIFNSIHKMRPDLMLWLGDNTYLRPADYSWTGIMHRYTHTRSLPELQALLGTTHHYAIWDDHDFGPNDSDRSFIHKNKTLEAFKLFWGNPSYGLDPDKDSGTTSYFKYNDIDFFLLDNRYFRRPNHRKSGEATMIGEVQREWLIDALVSSRAPFKMVLIGGQVLSNAEIYENYAHHHKAERDTILKLIEEEGVKGVIFLTGDRHHTELSKYTSETGFQMYDFTVSPLTSGPGRGADENNKYRVEGTHVAERNFGILDFSGPREDRVLKMTIYNTEGKEIWTQSIKASDFK